MLSRTTQDPLSLAEREGDKCRARHRNSPRCGSKERSDSMVPGCLGCRFYLGKVLLTKGQLQNTEASAMMMCF